MMKVQVPIQSFVHRMGTKIKESNQGARDIWQLISNGKDH